MSNPSQSPEPLPIYEIESDPSLAQRIGKMLRSWVFWLCVLGVVGLVLGVIFGPGLYREAKARRALGLIAEGEKALRNGDSQSAMSFFRRGQIIAPVDKRVNDRMIILSASSGNAASVEELQKRLRDGTATSEEILVVAEQGRARKDEAMTRSALDALPADLPEDLRLRRMLVQIDMLVGQGKLDEAVEFIEGGVGGVGTENAARLRLSEAEILLRKDPPDEAKADSILQELGGLNFSEGLRALRLLAIYRLQRRDAHVLSGGEISSRLLAHPLRQVGDRILASQLRVAENPDAQSETIREFVEAEKSSSLDDRVGLARWFIGKGLFQPALDVVPFSDVGNAEALLVHLDALSGLKRWEDSASLLHSDAAKSLSSSVRNLALARCSEELGRAAEALEFWGVVRRDVRLANPRELVFIARTAESRGRPAVAAAAYEVLARNRESAAEAYLGLLRNLPIATPLPEVRRIYEDLALAAPENVDALAGRTFFDLLAGEQVPRAIQTTANLREKDPNSVVFLTLAAFAALRDGKPKLALEIINSPVDPAPDWLTLVDRWKAVRVAILRENGLRDETLEASINRANLRLDEYELVSPKPKEEDEEAEE